MDVRAEIGKPLIILICGALVYYHCVYRNSSLLSLVSDVLIVLLCSLAILGLLFRQMNISVPVDPLEWQISQETANNIIACLANTIGAAESVLRVAATGHDKRLFFKVVLSLYALSALGRLVSGITVAYAVITSTWVLYTLRDTSNWFRKLRNPCTILLGCHGLWVFCLCMFAENSQTISACVTRYLRRSDDTPEEKATT